jgi:hypothetical protein
LGSTAVLPAKFEVLFPAMPFKVKGATSCEVKRGH